MTASSQRYVVDRGVPFPEGHVPLPVLYRSEMVGRWWPGVSRACQHCLGGQLILVFDEVRCLQCARVAFDVRDSRPRRLTDAELNPPRGRPTRPKVRRDGRWVNGYCNRGHLIAGDNVATDSMGYVRCRECRLQVHRRRRWRPLLAALSPWEYRLASEVAARLGTTETKAKYRLTRAANAGAPISVDRRLGYLLTREVTP